MHKVVNYVVYKGNPYNELLYAASAPRYELVNGDPETAHQVLEHNTGNILHIHWEEECIRRIKSKAAQRDAAYNFIEKISRYTKKSGKVIWTIHNLRPHDQSLWDSHSILHSELLRLSNRILIHNRSTLSHLDLNDSITPKVRLLPHPSYCGIYLPTGRTLASESSFKKITFFGNLRKYKGLDFLFSALDESFNHMCGTRISVYGAGLKRDDTVDNIVKSCQKRSDIDLHIGTVQNNMVAGCFEKSLCLVLPYSTFLNSGVALLGITLGVPVIAPAIDSIKELFPKSCHPLLFIPNNTADLQRAVLFCKNLSLNERNDILEEYNTLRSFLNPKRISSQLMNIYDEVLENV